MQFELIRDLRYGARILGRSGAFGIVAILTLALGIGANVAIFSVVHAILLRPLPFAEPARLVVVWERSSNRNLDRQLHSYPVYADLRDHAGSFTETAAWSSLPDQTSVLTGLDGPVEVRFSLASGNLFSVLGARAQHGRVFSPSDDDPAAQPVVLVSHAFGTRVLGETTKLVGNTLTLDGRSFTIAGVLPRDFRFGGTLADLWIPLHQDPVHGSGPRSRMYAPGARYLGVVARLAPGVTHARAAADLESVSRRLEEEDPFFRTNWRHYAVPFEESVRAVARTALLMLWGAVGLVLLVACVNLANLLTARGSTRVREMAVRMAIGASRGRLVQQLLVENALLAGIGGAAALWLAWWGIRLCAQITIASPDPLTIVPVLPEDIGLHPAIFLFTAALSLITAFVFGLGPAFGLADSAARALRAGRGTDEHRSLVVRRILVAGEVAATVILISGALLLTRSLIALQRIDPGFQPESAIAVELKLQRAKYDDTRTAAFYRQLLHRVAAEPGVSEAAATQWLPLSGPVPSTDFRLEQNMDPPPDARPMTMYNSVTARHFAAMGIALRAGRSFSENDDSRAPGVVIVSETFARTHWPNENPIGKRLALSIEALRFVRDGPPILDFPAAMREVVGVVGDVRYGGITDEVAPVAYIPFEQRPSRNMSLILRTRGDANMLGAAARRIISELDPDQPVSAVTLVEQLVSDATGAKRASTLLLTLFAALAVILAAIGIYGVIAFDVAQRTREIAIRLALGAVPSTVMGNLLRDGLLPVAAGLATGVAGALIAARWIRSVLYEVAPTDAASFLVATAFLAAIATLACVIPARRAARVEPMTALRQD